jgi:hypothetical protein
MYRLQESKADYIYHCSNCQSVSPKDHVKILGVLMDAGLKYHKHIARAAAKGLEAALELRRLRGLSPRVARQLFTATVAPTVDYASSRNPSTGPLRGGTAAPTKPADTKAISHVTRTRVDINELVLTAN